MTTLIVLTSFVVAQAVLVVALERSLKALYYHLSKSPLAKRSSSIIPPPPPDLLIRPLVPGSTLNPTLATVSLLFVVVATSQTFHEFGHALCAAAQGRQLDHVGFVWFAWTVPTFYVSVSSSHPRRRRQQHRHRRRRSLGRSRRRRRLLSDLRIASAGVWHNVVLVLCGLALSNERRITNALITIGSFERLETGLRVVEISDPGSPLNGLLTPFETTITHVDDLELEQREGRGGGPRSLFYDYLRSTTNDDDDEEEEQDGFDESYDNLGWCLAKESLKVLSINNHREQRERAGLECCDPERGSTRDSSHELCFKSPTLEEEVPPSFNDDGNNDGEATKTSKGNHLVEYATCLDPTLSLFEPAPPRRSLEERQTSSSSSRGGLYENDVDERTTRRKRAPRCLNQQSCEARSVCVRIRDRNVVRLRTTTSSSSIVVTGETNERSSRVVIWKGPRTELARIGNFPLILSLLALFLSFRTLFSSKEEGLFFLDPND